jgi:hypothetical protein
MPTRTTEDICQRVLVKCAHQKEAGLRSALKFLATGRSAAHHGTSAALANQIRKTGLVPNKTRGISDIVTEMTGVDPRGKNPLAFLTRRRGEGRTYAQQQGFIEALGKSPQQVAGDFGSEIAGNPLRGKPLGKSLGKLWRDLRKGVGGARAARKEGIVDMSYPAREFSPVKNPEPGLIRDKAYAAFQELRQPDWVAKGLAELQHASVRPAFMRTFGLAPGQGGVAMPSKFIKGSPDYQRVNFDEIKNHLRHAWKNPGTTAKETFKNLAEVQGL